MRNHVALPSDVGDDEHPPARRDGGARRDETIEHSAGDRAPGICSVVSDATSPLVSSTRMPMCSSSSRSPHFRVRHIHLLPGRDLVQFGALTLLQEIALPA